MHKDGGASKQPDGHQEPKMFSEDWYMLHFRTSRVDAVVLLQDYIRRSCLKMLRLVDPPAVNSMPLYTVLFGFGLLLTIIMALYTASAAAMLTTRSFAPAITSIEDLRGKAVGTWEDNHEALLKEGVLTVPFRRSNDQDEEVMLHALSSGFIQALVLEEKFVRYITSRLCSFVAVGRPFHIKDFGVGYNRRLQPELVRDMDRYLQAAVQAGLPEKMAALYIEEGPGCASAAAIDPLQGVRLSQVWGLWVALVVCLGLAGVLNSLQWLRRRTLKAAEDWAAQAVVRSAQMSATAVKGLLHQQALASADIALPQYRQPD